MKPMAVACHSGSSGNRLPPASRRISCQRSVRNGKVSVASATAASSSSGSARRRCPPSSCGSMSCSVHASSASVTASPTSHAQREARDASGGCGRLEGAGNEQGPDVHDRQGILRRRFPRGDELVQRRRPDAGLHQPLVRGPRAGEIGRLAGSRGGRRGPAAGGRRRGGRHSGRRGGGPGGGTPAPGPPGQTGGGGGGGGFVRASG